MTAKQLMLPANRAFDSDGAPATGARAFLYQSGTSTPAPFYDDVGLTVSLGSFITANSAGRFTPMPYQEGTTPFRIVIEDKEGAVLDDIDPFYFGQNVYSVSGSITAATRTVLAGLTGSVGSIALLTESGREGYFVWSSANNAANVTADPGQGVYVPPATDVTGASGAWVRKYSGAANPTWFGAVGDGATDDTTAVQRALNLATILHIPGKTFVASTLSVPSNRIVTFDENAVILQKAGTVSTTRLFIIAGSNVRIGDITIQGQLNQAGDTTGEQNHAIFVYATAATGSLAAISIGNIKATNIRGDALCVGTDNNTRSVSQISWGDVIVNNIYRNGISLVGNVFGYRGGTVKPALGATYGCGLRDVDLETDTGTGTTTGGRIEAVYGRCVGVAAPTAADFCNGIEFGYLNLDPVNHNNSNPAYITPDPRGLVVRNCKYVHVEKAKINGLNGPGVQHLYNGGDITKQTISFGELEITDCCKTDAVYYGFVSGAPGVTRLLIGMFKTDVTATKAGIAFCDNAVIGAIEATNVLTSGGLIRACANVFVGSLNHSGAGVPFLNTDNLIAMGGTVAATATTLCSFTVNPLFINYAVTATQLFNTVTNGRAINSTLNGTFYQEWTNGTGHAISAGGNISTVGTVTGSNLSGTNTGDGAYAIQTKITGYTVTETVGDVVVKADLAAGFTIVLPTAVGNKARFTFKKIQAAGAIVIDGNAAETIDGGLTATLNAQNESITIVSDNANWMII